MIEYHETANAIKKDLSLTLGNLSRFVSPHLVHLTWWLHRTAVQLSQKVGVFEFRALRLRAGMSERPFADLEEDWSQSLDA